MTGISWSITVHIFNQVSCSGTGEREKKEQHSRVKPQGCFAGPQKKPLGNFQGCHPKVATFIKVESFSSPPQRKCVICTLQVNAVESRFCFVEPDTYTHNFHVCVYCICIFSMHI